MATPNVNALAAYRAGEVSKSLFKVMLIAGAVTGGVGVLYHWGEQLRVMANAIMLLTFIVSLAILIYRPHYIRALVYTGIFVTAVAVFIPMREYPSQSYWLTVLPLISFALLGKNKGLICSLLCLLAYFLVLLFDQMKVEPLFSMMAASDMTGSFVLVIAFVYLFVRTIEAQHQEIEHQAESLLQATVKRERLEVAQNLAGGMAHLINNEMHAISGTAELLKLDMHDAQMIKDIDRIMALSHRASAHADHLVAYASGGQYTLQHMDIGLVVEALLKRWSSQLPEHIKAHITSPICSVDCIGDPVQTGQVLLGLLENAQEAIEERGVSLDQAKSQPEGLITVSFQQQVLTEDCLNRELQRGCFVVVTVEDNGCGINQASCDKIFEPFYSTHFAGRGMGLAVAQGIIKQHGGYIGVQSKLGQGSNFQVWLPTNSIVFGDATQ